MYLRRNPEIAGRKSKKKRNKQSKIAKPLKSRNKAATRSRGARFRNWSRTRGKAWHRAGNQRLQKANRGLQKAIRNNCNLTEKNLEEDIGGK